MTGYVANDPKRTLAITILCLRCLLTLDFGDVDTHIQFMPSIAKKRAERLFRWKQGGVHAASAYEAKEQATRLLTAKLRDERLAREAISGKPDRKKVAKA